MDGADWCQMFRDRHRPDAVCMLDFPHGGEHINDLLEALEKTSVHFPPHMLERCLHILKHRGPRPLLRMADQIPSDLAGQKGIHEHLDYLRKREALMQYPQFQRDGWPIGSGMVESANKNVVEARLKGAGMHWERKNVNPMLALRNAVCNGRWREMWRKAVLQHRKQHALQKSVRAEQRAQASLTVGNSSSQETPPQSAADTSQMSPPVTPSPPVPEASPPSSYRLSSRRKQHTAHNRVKYSHQRSGDGETCICGAPLVRLEGSGRTKQFCSNACRQCAYRQRQTRSKPPSAPPASTTIQPGSTQPSAYREIGSAHAKSPPQALGSVSKEICPCGIPLVQSQGGQSRRYCSDRCRQRAYRQRQKWVA